MKVHFGPFLSLQVKSALHYATVISSETVENQSIHVYDEDDSTLFTHVINSRITVNGITIQVDESPNVHSTENQLIQEVHGYFEADNIEMIQKFFETATDYTQNQVSVNKLKDKIKVLTFDYRWECDTPVKKKTYASIHLPPKILEDFRADFDRFLSPETKKRYEELELNPCRIYALYGPPGTGKTTLIHTVASFYSMNIACLSFDCSMNDRAFKMALKKMPVNTLLCLEDIDALFNENRKSAETHLTFSGVINALEGVMKLKNLIIFVTTNHINQLDPALKRRIDYFIKFDFCTKGQVKNMFERFVGQDDFELFWKECSQLKLTPSILQKFFIINFGKKVEEYAGNLKEFVEGEYGLEKTHDMYT